VAVGLYVRAYIVPFIVHLYTFGTETNPFSTSEATREEISLSSRFVKLSKSRFSNVANTFLKSRDNWNRKRKNPKSRDLYRLNDRCAFIPYALIRLYYRARFSELRKKKRRFNGFRFFFFYSLAFTEYGVNAFYIYKRIYSFWFVVLKRSVTVASVSASATWYFSTFFVPYFRYNNRRHRRVAPSYQNSICTECVCVCVARHARLATDETCANKRKTCAGGDAKSRFKARRKKKKIW